MSQETNAGFNAPGFSVGSGEPLSGTPVASIAWRGSGRPFAPYMSSLDFCDRSERQSRAAGVAHIAKSRIATNPALLPASLFPSFAFAREVGVGHSDRAIICGSGMPVSCGRIVSPRE